MGGLRKVSPEELTLYIPVVPKLEDYPTHQNKKKSLFGDNTTQKALNAGGGTPPTGPTDESTLIQKKIKQAIYDVIS